MKSAISQIESPSELLRFLESEEAGNLMPSDATLLSKQCAKLGFRVEIPKDIPSDLMAVLEFKSFSRLITGSPSNWEIMRDNFLNAIRFEVAANTTGTTQKTTAKKNSKKRPMNTSAVDCARRYKADNGRTPMKTIIEDYVQECGGSFDSIMRVLNDNPDQWKDDK